MPIDVKGLTSKEKNNDDLNLQAWWNYRAGFATDQKVMLTIIWIDLTVISFIEVYPNTDAFLFSKIEYYNIVKNLEPNDYVL